MTPAWSHGGIVKITDYGHAASYSGPAQRGATKCSACTFVMNCLSFGEFVWKSVTEGNEILTNDLSAFAKRPYRFILEIVRGYRWSHLAILLSVIAAVTFSVSTQYGVKKLVDALSDPSRHATVWAAFALLIGFIAADNLSWRLAAWIGHSTFTGITGRVRRKAVLVEPPDPADVGASGDL